jgi:hypothetical protein
VNPKPRTLTNCPTDRIDSRRLNRELMTNKGLPKDPQIFFVNTLITPVFTAAKHHDIQELMFEFSKEATFGRASGVNVTPAPYPTHSAAVTSSVQLRCDRPQVTLGDRWLADGHFRD